jgi:hypothetical protein
VASPEGKPDHYSTCTAQVTLVPTAVSMNHVRVGPNSRPKSHCVELRNTRLTSEVNEGVVAVKSHLANGLQLAALEWV